MYQFKSNPNYLYQEILEAISKLTGIHYHLLSKINQVKGDRFIITYYNLDDELEVLEIETSKVTEVLEAKRLPRSFDITVNLTPENGTYTAVNKAKNHRYFITPFSDSIHCTCADYAVLGYYFHTNKVCCKHILSFLRNLGYKTLEDYLKDHQKLPVNNYQTLLYPYTEQKDYQLKYREYLNREMYVKDDRAYYL